MAEPCSVKVDEDRLHSTLQLLVHRIETSNAADVMLKLLTTVVYPGVKLDQHRLALNTLQEV